MAGIDKKVEVVRFVWPLDETGKMLAVMLLNLNGNKMVIKLLTNGVLLEDYLMVDQAFWSVVCSYFWVKVHFLMPVCWFRVHVNCYTCILVWKWISTNMFTFIYMSVHISKNRCAKKKKYIYTHTHTQYNIN